MSLRLELDQLVDAALQAGAAGAKLCGGGRGGNMIALAGLDDAASIAAALHQGRRGQHHHHHGQGILKMVSSGT